MRRSLPPILTVLLALASLSGSLSPSHVVASYSHAPPRTCGAGSGGSPGAGALMGRCSASDAGQQAYISRYGRLWSAAVDAQGQVFVLDRAAAHLLKLSPTGRLLHRWAIPPIYVPNQPSDLTGITIGPQHTLYLTDAYNYQVIRVRTNGQVIGSWDTRHIGERRPAGPFGVALDASGNLYVPNFAFSEVQKYSSTGKLLLTFGRPCPQSGKDESAASACTDEGHQTPGELNHPDSITLDRQGNLYVSDHRSRRIVKLSPDGTEIATFGPRLPAPYGSFGLTEGVAVDAAGNIYVEDRSGPRVVKLSPRGVPLAQWKAPKGYVPEGTPGMDARGNLYLTLNAKKGPCMVITLFPDLQVRSRWL